MNPKDNAIEISEMLKGVNNSDNVKYNTQAVCLKVVDALESVLGSQRHIRTEHENEVIEFWKQSAVEAKSLQF